VKEAAPSLGPQPSSPEEIERWQVARHHGDPFHLYRTAGGRLQVLSLPGSWEQVNIGRSAGAEISLPWDERVSTVHAKLERVGDDWVLVDDGLSRNGSFVNGEPIPARRRLLDGDELRFGRTSVLFYAPLQVNQRTVAGSEFGS
jgi:pSer/pThr/pTyr-binding forkhead associated (FHA) protein